MSTGPLKKAETRPSAETTVHLEVSGSAARDERIVLPLDPEVALRGLLQVDPKSRPVEGE